MKVDVRHNISEVTRSIVTLRSDIKTKATVRALNRAADRVRSAAGREIRKVYKIKAADVRKASKVERASLASGTLTATVTVSGRRISLIAFSARAVNPWNVRGRSHRPGGGVSVQVKVQGGRKTVQHAFIATTRKGFRGVFIREAVAGAPRMKGGAQQGAPIVNLRSISLPYAFTSRAVTKALETIAVQAFTDRFEHELNFLLAK